MTSPATKRPMKPGLSLVRRLRECDPSEYLQEEAAARIGTLESDLTETIRERDILVVAVKRAGEKRDFLLRALKAARVIIKEHDNG